MHEFDFEVKDRKGIENQVVDHLYRLEEEAMQNIEDGLYIDDCLPDEQILVDSQDLIPWFADYANYLSSDLVQQYLSLQKRTKFMHKVRKFFCEGPYLFKICMDGIIRRCTPQLR